MSSLLRAVLWLAALILAVGAVWALVQWVYRPAPGSAAVSPVETAATPPAGAGSLIQAATGETPAVNAAKADPGEELYSSGWYDRAIAHWIAAAEKGDAVAAYRLAVEYLDGKPGVVQRDLAKALKYHTQAAGAGEPRSMFDLGTMHEFGMGVPKDIKIAAQWFRRAADYGHAQGQYNFATMLEAGEGVSQDLVEAFKFYGLAAAQGFRGVPYDAKRNTVDKNQPDPLTLLKDRMSAEQIREGNDRIAAFKPLSGSLKLD